MEPRHNDSDVHHNSQQNEIVDSSAGDTLAEGNLSDATTEVISLSARESASSSPPSPSPSSSSSSSSSSSPSSSCSSRSPEYVFRPTVSSQSANNRPLGEAALDTDGPPSQPRLCHLIRTSDQEPFGCKCRHMLKSAKGLAVDRTMPDSPASRAGLAKDDRILEIDGESVRNLTKEQVYERLTTPGLMELRMLVVDRQTSRWYRRRNIEITSNLAIVVPVQPSTSASSNTTNENSNLEQSLRQQENNLNNLMGQANETDAHGAQQADMNIGCNNESFNHQPTAPIDCTPQQEHQPELNMIEGLQDMVNSIPCVSGQPAALPDGQQLAQPITGPLSALVPRDNLNNINNNNKRKRARQSEAAKKNKRKTMRHREAQTGCYCGIERIVEHEQQLKCKGCKKYVHLSCEALTSDLANKIHKFYCRKCEREKGELTEWIGKEPTEEQAQMKKEHYHDVECILDHEIKQVCDEHGIERTERMFLVKWRAGSRRRKSSESWEPEAHLDGCVRLLNKYCRDHQLELTKLDYLLGAADTKSGTNVSINEDNFVYFSSIMAEFNKERRRLRLGKISLPVYAIDCQFGHEDQLFLMPYLRHCYVGLYVADKKQCVLADGSNLFMNDVVIRRGLLNELEPLNGTSVMAVEYVNRCKVDYCGSAAVTIAIEFLRHYGRGVMPANVFASRRKIKELEKKMHKGKKRSQVLETGTPSAASNLAVMHKIRASLKCPNCGWSKIGSNKSAFLGHLRHCNKKFGLA